MIPWLERMRFRRRVPIQRAGRLEWRRSMTSAFAQADSIDGARFVAKGYRPRQFFPHRWYALRKCGPDGYKLARRMCGTRDPNHLWQIVLYATSPAIDEFPADLFFDADLNWHEQQFNRPGQIASATLAVVGRRLYTAAHQSDLVQRISRNRQFKTRVERVFEGWHRMLLNGITAFADAQGLERVYVPTSALAMEQTDQRRSVQPELFERVYDRATCHHFHATRDGRWWCIDVAGNRDAIVAPHRRTEPIESGRTICLAHDIEHGLGHREVDAAFSRRADEEAPAALSQMLHVERLARVRATYNVVGCLLSSVRDRIERDGHCLAFHSFDHGAETEQLEACRRIDYRIKGYRPPRSRLTDELQDATLCWHNVEWLASSASSLGLRTPTLTNRIVKIPILFDDFDLHRQRTTFDEWAQRALGIVEQHDVTAFCLHDCYAPHWLPYYERFLEDLRKLGHLRTLDELAADLFIASAV